MPKQVAIKAAHSALSQLIAETPGIRVVLGSNNAAIGETVLLLETLRGEDGFSGVIQLRSDGSWSIVVKVPT